MTQLHQNGDTSLHDIGGHLCVQRGPRGIRTMVESFPELLKIAAEEIPLDNEDLDALGKYFPAGAPRPPGAKAGLPDLPADRLDPGYTQYLDAHFETLGNEISELKERIPAQAEARFGMADDIVRWVDRTFWPNDRSAEAVRELAHAVRRNDVAAFVDGEGFARYDRDEGDRKAARWRHADLLNLVDQVGAKVKAQTGVDADTVDSVVSVLLDELREGGE